MGMSDKIEAFINELLKNETEEWLQIQRNELASVFGCVPSQINYVISTRFNPEHGYAVESKRGGGGYLKIKRIRCSNDLIAEAIQAAPDALDEETALKSLKNLTRLGALDEKTANVIFNGISDASLDIERRARDKRRARIFKNMLAAAEKY